MKVLLFVFCYICLIGPTYAQSDFVEKKLYEMPDVIFKKIDTPSGFEAVYELMVKQPLDHTNASLGSFYQRVFYSYRNADAPTVMITEGYERPTNRIYELTNLLKGNQIQVEHRYFGKSVPDSMEYKYLTLENATADLHKINQLFRSIHDNDFISTGISKGGQTTIFYRYFYPNDVDVSVPYVAPLNTSLEDKRIYEFLQNIGTEDCRIKIKNLQKRLLKDRRTYLEKLKWYTKGTGNHYTYLNLEQAYEYAVLEYSFSFWQWGSNCDDIPNADASEDMVFEHFIKVSDPSFFADESMKQYASHYYQAGTQMGYYGYDISEFKDLIKALPSDKNPSAVFMPNKAALNFNDTLTKKVSDWVNTKGDEFIYIYGANDTWSATGVKPNKQRNSLWYFIDGKDHGQARIKNLSEESKQELLSKIDGWLKAKP